ncbi:hypothetical protein [Streptosporangium sp. NPDC006007]|uniref:hypothetical protein n=1 Tax=Streptosporangium sp. NPDC006007 TaxID=3154575 RepID=UPI0033AFBC85
MTDSPDDEYGELLRRALNAEANSVVPSPDGLEIIRTRIERRGLRGLMWWRAGASVAGAVLVAATVVMVVPQLREQVTEQVTSGEVNFTESTSPEMSATSRPPVERDQRPLPVIRPGVTSPSIGPSKTSAPSPTATPRPSRTPKPTPSPTCPTTPATTVEPEGLPKECKETETPTPTPAEPGGPSDPPCAVGECPPPVDNRQPLLPTAAATPTPSGR